MMAKGKPAAELDESLWVPMDRAAVILGIPETMLQEWVNAGLIPPPRTFNQRVIRYPAKVVHAIDELIQYGWLPRPENPVRS